MKKVTSLFLILLFFCIQIVQGQVSTYQFDRTFGTYSSITGGTQNYSGNFDDGSSLANLPFSFSFNGAAYSSVWVSANGYIVFGNTDPTAGSWSNASVISQTLVTTGAVAGWAGDLSGWTGTLGGQTAEVRSEVLGTSPNRVAVFQWRARPAYATSTTNAAYLSFQIRLEETTNKVVVVYGPSGQLIGTTNIGTTRQVGLRGATNADYNNRTNSTSVAFDASTSGTLNSQTQAYSSINALPGRPTSGLTYTFSPPVITTPPNCATIVSPANAATGISKNASLNWASGGGGPTGYKLYFGTDNPPTNIINGTDLGLVTTYSPVMDYSTTYYWQAIPYNTYGDATGCSVWSFTTMADPTIYALPHLQSFDDVTFPPFGWTNVKTAGTSTPGLWNRQTSGTNPTCSPYSGAAMARYNCYSISSGGKAELTSPPINFPDDNYRVNFWMYRDPVYPTLADRVNVYYNTTGSSVGGILLGTINRSTTLAPVVSAEGWYNYIFSLPAGAGGNSCFIIFEGVSVFGNNIFIDHILIEEKPASGTLAGIVKDEFNNPLQGVLISADLTDATTLTNASGAYSMELIIGTFDVTFSKSGYITEVFENVGIEGGLTTTLNTTLNEIPGSKCSNAIVVGAFPYEALNQTNCGYGNFYSETCLGSYDGGDDILYQFTLTSTKDVVITVNPNGTDWAGILLASDCPPVNCVDFKTNGSATTPMVISKRLEAGTYYVMVDTWPTPNCIPSFDLTITAQDPPPPGKITGLVFDQNGNRLPNVKVTLGDAKTVVYTNALGRYNFFTVEPGLYDVSFEKANYITQLIENVEVEPAGTTELNVNMALVPAPDCPTLVYPAVDQTVLPSISLQWAPSGINAATGYKLYLYNVTSDIWIEENTDIGNVTSYTPAEPFESGSYFAWLLVPYNFSGETLGCEPWFFYVSYFGHITGVITDNSTSLPIQNAAILVQQTLPGNYSTTIYTDATGAYNFEWQSGNYNLTISKYGYTSKTLSNVPINPNQTTVMNTTLNPVVPYSIPFVENWGSGTFAAQQWTVVPSSPQWSVQSTVGNPAPTARFYWDPRVYNYSRRLQSHFINGVGKDKIYAQFDLLLQNYSKLTIEKLIFGVYDGTQWHVVNTFNNQGVGTGSIPWTNFSYDISQFAAGKLFQLGFTAEGGDNYNIDWWYVDNIYLTTSLMAVQPPSISDQLGTTGTSQWPITISNPGVKALFWNATLNLPQPWATLSAMSGVVSAGGQQVIQLNFNGAAVPPGVYQGQVVITGANGVVSEIVNISLNVYGLTVAPGSITSSLLSPETSVHDIQVTNPGSLPVNWVATLNAGPWASLSQTSGSLAGFASQTIQVTFNSGAVPAGSYLGNILFSGNNGLVQQNVDLALETFIFEPDQSEVKEALPVDAESETEIVIYYQGPEAIDWEAEFIENVKSHPWVEVSPTSGTVEPGGEIVITLTLKSGSTKNTTYNTTLVITANEGEIELEIPILLKVYDGPFQKVMVPKAGSWGLISSYVDVDSKVTLETLMAEVKDDVTIMLSMNGIYWPGQSINTIGNWNTYEGYKIKMSDVGLFVIEGVAVQNKSVTFPAGTYFVPVLSETSVSATSIFGGVNLGKIEFAFGLDGSIWWPFGNIYTLQTLLPGYGYLVKFNAQTTLNFASAKSEDTPNSGTLASENPWNEVITTGDFHIVGVSTEATATLSQGDIIGFFDAKGTCRGSAVYQGKNAPFTVNVFGDDYTTSEIDGMIEGEPMFVRIFSNNEVIEIEPVYSNKLVHADGLFALNGLSLITDLKAGSTGIGGSQNTSLRIYPNPSNGLFNIDGADASYNVTVMNSQGQVVYNSKLNAGRIDLTGQPSGVYFIRLVGNDQTITQKVVIR